MVLVRNARPAGKWAGGFGTQKLNMKIIAVIHEEKTPRGTLTVYRCFGDLKATFISNESFEKCRFGVFVQSADEAKKLIQ